MSVRSDAANDRADCGSTAPATNNFTAIGKVQLVVDRNDYSVWFSFDDGGSTYHQLGTDSDGVTPCMFSSAATLISLSAMTVGDWYGWPSSATGRPRRST